MALEIEKIIKIIIVVVVLVIVVVSIAVVWQKYLKPYLEDLGKAETAGIKAGLFLLFIFKTTKVTKRYLNSYEIVKI